MQKKPVQGRVVLRQIAGPIKMADCTIRVANNQKADGKDNQWILYSFAHQDTQFPFWFHDHRTTKSEMISKLSQVPKNQQRGFLKKRIICKPGLLEIVQTINDKGEITLHCNIWKRTNLENEPPIFIKDVLEYMANIAKTTPAITTKF